AGLAPRLTASPQAAALAEDLADTLADAQQAAPLVSVGGILVWLAPHLPAALLPDALAAVLQIVDPYERARGLEALAPHLPEALLADALTAVLRIPDPFGRAIALGALAPHLPASPRTAALAA